jgi:hypothetical protein
MINPGAALKAATEDSGIIHDHNFENNFGSETEQQSVPSVRMYGSDQAM